MRSLTCLVTSLFCLSATTAFAGPGHDHGDGAFASSGGAPEHLTITSAMRGNLGIRTAKAEKHAMASHIEMLAFTELLPEKQTQIASRFNGRVVALHVKLGQEVRIGDELLTLEPLVAGSAQVVIRSTTDGFVIQQNVVVGQSFQPKDVLMLVGDNSEMLVRGIAYETPDINRIKVGQDADIHLNISPDEHLHGTIQRIDLAIDPKTRTFAVYAILPTPDRNIMPNLQGLMEVRVGDDAPALTIPRRAILGEMGQYFVYVLKGNEAQKRDVKTGIRNASHVEIISGLEEGDAVITHGNYQLQYASGGHAHGEEDAHGHEHKEGEAHEHGEEGHEHEDGDEHDHDHGEEGHDHDHEEPEQDPLDMMGIGEEE